MSTFFSVLLVCATVLVVCYMVTAMIARTIVHHHPPSHAPIPDGETRERSARLKRESERYKDYLSDRLIQRESEQRRRR
jgi:hypothetical protein